MEKLDKYNVVIQLKCRDLGKVNYCITQMIKGLEKQSIWYEVKEIQKVK